MAWEVYPPGGVIRMGGHAVGMSIVRSLSPTSTFDPLGQVTPLHAVWAGDPAWTNPGDGQPVTSWRNSSGGGDPASTGTNRPTFRAATAAYNNRPTVQFVAASSQYLDFDVANASQPFKVVIVGNVSATGAVERFLGRGASANGIGSSAANQWSHNWGTTISAGTATATPRVFRSTVDAANTVLLVNGVSTVTGNAGAGGIGRFTLGAGSSATPTYDSYLTGHIAFLGIYSGATSDVALAALETALAAHYGITL